MSCRQQRVPAATEPTWLIRLPLEDLPRQWRQHGATLRQACTGPARQLCAAIRWLQEARCCTAAPKLGTQQQPSLEGSLARPGTCKIQNLAKFGSFAHRIIMRLCRPQCCMRWGQLHQLLLLVTCKVTRRSPNSALPALFSSGFVMGRLFVCSATICGAPAPCPTTASEEPDGARSPKNTDSPSQSPDPSIYWLRKGQGETATRPQAADYIWALQHSWALLQRVTDYSLSNGARLGR